MRTTDFIGSDPAERSLTFGTVGSSRLDGRAGVVLAARQVLSKEGDSK